MSNSFSFPAVQFGPLYYKHLQHDKSEIVKQKRGSFDKCMRLSSNALQELKLWEQNIPLNKLNYQTQPGITQILHKMSMSHLWWIISYLSAQLPGKLNTTAHAVKPSHLYNFLKGLIIFFVI